MSEQRTPISEETKVKLLRETNYRCGYCLKNITPVAYFTENRNSKEAKTEIPTYYQSYDVAHIVPYNETQDQSFENLIALCKDCHWKSEPNHNNAMIPRDKLKELKLYWMINSFYISEYEINVMMALWYTIKRWLNLTEKYEAEDIEIKNQIETYIKENFPSMNIYFSKTYIDDKGNSITAPISFEANIGLLSLFHKSLNMALIRYRKVMDYSNSQMFDVYKTTPIEKSPSFISNMCNNFVITLDQKGINFCNKFADVYKNN